MKNKTYPIILSEYYYGVLLKNSIIPFVCADELNTAKKQNDEVELHLTRSELEDLIGYVAGEANHARKKQDIWDLNEICDLLEMYSRDIFKSTRN